MMTEEVNAEIHSPNKLGWSSFGSVKTRILIIVALVLAAIIPYIGISYYIFLTYVPELCPHTDKIDILYFTDYSQGAIDLKLNYIFNISSPNPVEIRDVCLPNSVGRCGNATPNFWQIIGLQPLESVKILCSNSTSFPAWSGLENCTMVVDDFIKRHMYDQNVVKKYNIEGVAVGLCDSRKILRGVPEIINYFENFGLVRFV